MVANIDAGGAAINALARVAERDAGRGPGRRTRTRCLSASALVRRGSNIATEDALTNDEGPPPRSTGQQIADEEG